MVAVGEKKVRGATFTTRGVLSPPNRTLVAVIFIENVRHLVRYKLKPPYKIHQLPRRRLGLGCDNSRDAVCSDKTLLGEKISAAAAARERKASTKGEDDRGWSIIAYLRSTSRLHFYHHVPPLYSVR